MLDHSMEDTFDRRRFLRGAGRLAVAAGLEGVLATVAGCSPTHRSAAPPTTSGSSTTAAAPKTTTTTAEAGPIDWSGLSQTLTGQLVLPTSSGYATARQEFNPRFDTVAPVAIAYCQSADDIARCVAFARQHEVTPIPRSGGHSYAGWSTGTGLVVDVSAMNRVVIDQAAGTVTVGAGTKLVDLYTTLAGAGLALAGGSCPTVGIAGLTLGGGHGVIDRKYGLTCDALTGLELVTADSRTLTCDPATNSDLWWASRGGGGGSFAIASSFTFSPHPIGPIALFTLEWPWAAAGDVVDAWLSWGQNVPDELWANCQLGATSGGGTPQVKVTGVYLGTPNDLSTRLAPLSNAVGTALTDRFVGAEPYLRAMFIEAGCINDTEAQCHVAAPDTAGVLTRSPFAAKSDFLTAPLPAAGVQAVISAVEERQASTIPGGGAIVLDLFGGAINQVAAADSGFVHRNCDFLMQYTASWDNGASAGVVDGSVAWLRQAWASLRPSVSGQAYQNYADPDLVDWQEAYYGSNLARLSTVKSTYDADNVFHFPQSIPLP